MNCFKLSLSLSIKGFEGFLCFVGLLWHVHCHIHCNKMIFLNESHKHLPKLRVPKKLCAHCTKRQSVVLLRIQRGRIRFQINYEFRNTSKQKKTQIRTSLIFLNNCVMNFNALITVLNTKNSRKNNKSLRSKYLNEKYQERSISNRYFK